jgi:NADPH2:quinone reductase
MTTDTMNAVRVHKPGDVSALVIDKISRPTAGTDEVVVQNHFAGVNYIDTYQRSGLYPATMPLILGREGSGVITEVGPNVSDLKTGDRVAYIGGTGSYSQYSSVPTKGIIKLPTDVTLEQGAACLLQGMTAAYLVFDSYKVRPGDMVLVPAAAGGTGSLICQLASAQGAIVIGTVSTAAKVKTAHDSGAAHVIVGAEPKEMVTEVQRITNGRGVNVIYDGIGKDMWGPGLQCLAKRGYYIYFGNASGTIEDVDPFVLTPKCNYLMRPALMNYIETREELLARTSFN